MSGRDGVCILSREDVTQTSEREETDLFIASSADLINSSFDPRLSALKKNSPLHLLLLIQHLLVCLCLPLLPPTFLLPGQHSSSQALMRGLS